MAYIGADPANTGTGLFSQDTFTGDGSTVAFDLTNAVPDGGGNEIQVFVDNVRQQEGSSNAYTIGLDGSSVLKRVTFTAAPAAAQKIFVLNPGTKNVQQLSTVGDNTVTTAKVQDSAVSTAKITDLNVTTAKIAADAINATKIADDAISEEHLDVTALTGNPELSATAAADDVLLVFDTSSGTIKKIQASNINNAPTITSISPTNALTGDGTGNHTFTITGTNYDASAQAHFVNASGAEVTFDSVTRNSITQLTGVIAKSSLPGSGEPYDIVVLNPNGQQAKKRNQVNINQTPVFITNAGTLGTVNGNASVSLSVNATDPESAGNVTFEIQSGALPAGLTLTNTAAEGGTAIISGTATNPGANTTSNFVLRAVDAASNTSSRAFAITVNRIFTSQSFTSSGTFAVPSGTTSLTQVLLVAGGGGAGTDHGAGGGAGGLIFQPEYPVTPGGTIAVTVGSGGGGHPSGGRGTSGQDSIFGASPSPGKHPTGDVLTASGGGGGGGGNTNVDGGNGGSGGGGSGHGSNTVGSTSDGGQGQQSTASGDSGAYGFGNNGGIGQRTGTGSLFGGGGGGAGAVGSQGCGQSCSAGGIGKSYTIADGTTGVYYAGGGAGQHFNNSNTTRPGGQGGGGNSQSTPGGDGQDGGANKGGGAGAQKADGGKGIVIVRY
tara:strand:+ start:213 stop:2204 length:1992 start_codon:yes stop_codon:yes gene_type:complete